MGDEVKGNKKTVNQMDFEASRRHQKQTDLPDGNVVSSAHLWHMLGSTRGNTCCHSDCFLRTRMHPKKPHNNQKEDIEVIEVKQESNVATGMITIRGERPIMPTRLVVQLVVVCTE